MWSLPCTGQGGAGAYGQAWMRALELRRLTQEVSGSHDKLRINGLVGH